MPEKINDQSRRSFLGKFTKGVVGASLFPTILTAADKQRNLQSLSRIRQKYSPNDTIQIGLIGAGGMGTADAATAITVSGVKLVAACDLLSITVLPFHFQENLLPGYRLRIPPCFYSAPLLPRFLP